MSQSDLILDHLRRQGAITPLVALRAYGCMRLAARIRDLRRAGYRIATIRTTTTTGKHIAAYEMEAT